MDSLKKLKKLVDQIISLDLDLTDTTITKELGRLQRLTTTPESFNIKKYEWVDGKLNVEGNVSFPNRKLGRLPFDFGIVTGSFNCAGNRLTSLEGAPEKVGGEFSCKKNSLSSLKGGPKEVGEGYDCGNNKLTSLEGAPREVKRFYCDNNKLTSLEGAPREVKFDFRCSGNRLTSLQGAPRKVGWSFYCSNNRLTTLQGAPEEVGEGFHCAHNPTSPFQLLKTLFVDGKLPKKYEWLEDKIGPNYGSGWKNLMELEKQGLLEESEDDDILKALEKVSK